MNARKLTSYSDRIQADITKSILESAEIPVEIRSDSAIGYQGNMFSVDGFHLYVSEDMYEEAKQVLLEIENQIP